MYVLCLFVCVCMFMYECLCVCVYVCLFVCMFVCLSVCMVRKVPAGAALRPPPRPLRTRLVLLFVRLIHRTLFPCYRSCRLATKKPATEGQEIAHMSALQNDTIGARSELTPFHAFRINPRPTNEVEKETPKFEKVTTKVEKETAKVEKETPKVEKEMTKVGKETYD